MFFVGYGRREPPGCQYDPLGLGPPLGSGRVDRGYDLSLSHSGAGVQAGIVWSGSADPLSNAGASLPHRGLAVHHRVGDDRAGSSDLAGGDSARSFEMAV